jgi:hypothetical protein
VTDWDIEDPKGKSIEKVREIRDVVDARVKERLRSWPKLMANHGLISQEFPSPLAVVHTFST